MNTNTTDTATLTLQQPETLPGWSDLDHRTQQLLRDSYWAARRERPGALREHMAIRVAALETSWEHQDGDDGPLVSRVSERGAATLDRLT